MDEKKCKRCDVYMENKGKMTSGNANFIVWRCPSCNQQEMECTGIIK